ncbi:hypothetical protein V6K52_13350 [Knoellia sp. S7-12]|uniref:hypothetical protein n=1 Tax=Knoellia sp. S7-12 TaxID=3126698 RepID=UPI003365F003
MCTAPWLMCVLVLGNFLHANDTSVGDLLRYAGYAVFGIALPGTVLLRCLLPDPRPLVDDLALGSALGMALQLLVFIPAVVSDHGTWLRWWPLVLVFVATSLPALRRRWWRPLRPSSRSDTQPSRETAPVWWHWGVASGATVGGAAAAPGLLALPLPPGEGGYYVDMLWHLGLVHALTRAVPPEVPQVAGTTVEYHWFADADMAAATLVSGVPEAVVLLRLWPVAVVLLGVVLTAVLARSLSGVWWAGVIAAWIFATLRGLLILPINLPESPIIPYSPSHGYVVVMTLAAVLLIVWALRGGRLGVGWVAVVLCLAAAGGGKPAALPTIACGAVVALGAALLIHRRSRAFRAALAVLAACAVLLPFTSTYLSGSDSTSSLRLFSFMEWMPFYREVTGATRPPVAGPLLPEGINDLSSRSLQVLVLALLALALTHAGLLLGVATVARRTVRRDLVAWFFAGTLGASFGAYLVVSHPAYSQVYFVRLALAYAAAVSAWILVGAIHRINGTARTRALTLGFGFVIGLGLAWVTSHLSDVPVDRVSLDTWRSAFLLSAGVFFGGLAVVGLALMIASRTSPRWQGAATAVVASALILGAPAYAVLSTELTPVTPVLQAIKGTQIALRPDTAGGQLPMPQGGGAAMDWINRHLPDDAVVATNRHCSRGTTAKGCTSNLAMVSGLGGRQTVIESTHYVPVTGGPPGANPYPVLLRANDALFTDPSADGFARMKRDVRLTWLVADSTATTVSARITDFATPRFTAGTITVYEVR